MPSLKMKKSLVAGVLVVAGLAGLMRLVSAAEPAAASQGGTSKQFVVVIYETPAQVELRTDRGRTGKRNGATTAGTSMVYDLGVGSVAAPRPSSRHTSTGA